MFMLVEYRWMDGGLSVKDCQNLLVLTKINYI